MKGALGKRHLSEVAHCGGPRERVPLLGTLGYEQKALEPGISLYGGPAGQPGVGSSTGNFERWLKGAVEVGNHYGSSVKRTWREGSYTLNPGRYGKKGSGYGHLSPYRHHWGTWRGFTCWDF